MISANIFYIFTVFSPKSIYLWSKVLFPGDKQRVDAKLLHLVMLRSFDKLVHFWREWNPENPEVISLCQAIAEIQDLAVEPRVLMEYLNLIRYLYAKKKKKKVLCKSSLNNYINIFLPLGCTVQIDYFSI